jgi:hypothetical protein
MSDHPKFAAPEVFMRGRNYWFKRTVEQYKADLIAHTLGVEPTPVPVRDDDTSLLSTAQIAKIFNVHPRSVARWHLGDNPAPHRRPKAA